jgi:hypothetical protein
MPRLIDIYEALAKIRRLIDIPVGVAFTSVDDHLFSDEVGHDDQYLNVQVQTTTIEPQFTLLLRFGRNGELARSEETNDPDELMQFAEFVAETFNQQFRLRHGVQPEGEVQVIPHDYCQSISTFDTQCKLKALHYGEPHDDGQGHKWWPNDVPMKPEGYKM